MASKYINNSAYATSGYTLDGVNAQVTIGPMGVIGGPGLGGGTHEAYAIVNRGSVTGMTTGVYLQDGGAVTNSGAAAMISGYRYGVHVENVQGAVVNTGTIEGTDSFQSAGVLLSAGGSVTNTGGTALIAGYDGVFIAGAVGTVVNSGEIKGLNNDSVGVTLTKGGTVENAAGALIEATKGGVATYAGSIANSGTIESTGLFNTSDGIYVAAGGAVTNSRGALIEGLTGVYFKAKSSLSNAGTIIGAGGTSSIGVELYSGGTITNAVGGLIEGVKNAVLNQSGTVINAGSIKALGSTGRGVYLDSGESSLTNALTNAAGGVIQGYYGVLAGTVDNAGTITGTHFGIDGSLTTNELTGRIEGNVGVFLGLGTLINFGVITSTAGASGMAVNLTSIGDTFVNQGGSATIGEVVSNAGTMLLAGSKGVITGIGVAFTDFALVEELSTASWTFTGTNQDGSEFLIYGAATVSGAITGGGVLAIGGGATTFVKGASLTIPEWAVQDATLIYDVGLTYAHAFSERDGMFKLVKDTAAFTGPATFSGGTISGAGGVLAASGKTLIEGITVEVGSQMMLKGPSEIEGTIAGAGLLAIDANTTELEKGAKLTIAHWDVQTATVEYEIALSYAGQFMEKVGLFKLTKDTATFTGAATLTGGTFTGAGSTLVTRGATALAGLLVDGGLTWETFGTTTETAALTLGAAGGSAGTLVVEAGGLFDITANVGIAIGGGGKATFDNMGTFEKTAGAGASDIAPAVANTGTIGASAGTLVLEGAVSGKGVDLITKTGTLEFDAAVAATQTVKFATTTGELVLNDPAGAGLGFAGLVSGFAAGDRLDLRTFAASGGPRLSYAQAGAQGTLTITDGAKTARIALFGQYLAGGFRAANDGAGGTAITYVPQQSPAALAQPHSWR